MTRSPSTPASEIPSPPRPESKSSTGRFNGLFWGDNVVFAADDAADVEPFFLAVAAQARLYEASAFVTLVREPAEIARAYPGPRRRRCAARRPAGPAAATPRRHCGALHRGPAAASPLRLDRGDERALGARDGGALLLARLPAAARARGDRLLVAPRRPAHAGVATRDRGNHAVRARRRRRSAADRQGGGTTARRRGERVSLRPRGRPARARGRAGGRPARARRSAASGSPVISARRISPGSPASRRAPSRRPSGAGAASRSRRCSIWPRS